MILPIGEEAAAACGAALVDEKSMLEIEDARADKRKREIWNNLRVDEIEIRVAARKDRNAQWVQYYRRERERHKNSEREARLCVAEMVAEAGCPAFQDRSR